MRTACCRVPDLPLAARLRAKAAASPALERTAREALLDAALSLSPRAALVPRATGAFAAEAAVLVDASGVSALFCSEQGFAAALEQRCQRLGLPSCVAIASSQSLARIAARGLSAGEVRVLPPGSEAAFLAPLPLDILDPDAALAEALARFGVRCVHDLLALPRRALGTRLGPRVLDLAALARGEEIEPPLPAPAPGRLTEAADLEFAIARLEPLGFVLQGLLSRLLARLEVRWLACAELELRLDLEGGGCDVRRVGLAAPTLDLRVLMRLLVHALETRPPEGPVTGAALGAEGCSLQSDQLDLFRPAGPAPSTLGRTLAELQALCGPQRIGAPRTADDHRAHRFEMAAFEPARPKAAQRAEGERRRAPARAASTSAKRRENNSSCLGVCALRPPVHAEVRLQGRGPGWIRSPVANGRVVHLAGPWRTTGGWWSPESRFAYDYFDVETSDGTIARLRFDHVRKRWQIDAVYD